MLVRILRDDPPRAGSITLFVTSETEEEAKFVDGLTALCYRYLADQSGTAILPPSQVKEAKRERKVSKKTKGQNRKPQDTDQR